MSIDKKLVFKLRKIFLDDQKERSHQWRYWKRLTALLNKKEMTKSYHDREIKKMRKELLLLDKKNTNFIRLITKKNEISIAKLLGKRGIRYFWLLTQHADHDPRFQKKVLQIFKNTEKGIIDLKYIALLTDRILVHEGKKQEYGTQFQTDKNGNPKPFPIRDPIHLDQRRKKMKMESFSQYKKKIGAFYR